MKKKAYIFFFNEYDNVSVKNYFELFLKQRKNCLSKIEKIISK